MATNFMGKIGEIGRYTFIRRTGVTGHSMLPIQTIPRVKAAWARLYLGYIVA